MFAPGSALKRPGSQAMHAAADVAPVALLHLPGAHSVQLDAPVWSLQEPMAQSAQVALVEAPSAGEEVPTPHLVQLAALASPEALP